MPILPWHLHQLFLCKSIGFSQVKTGEALLIPGGWPHAFAAVSDCLLVGSQLLHLANMELQVWGTETQQFKYAHF